MIKAYEDSLELAHEELTSYGWSPPPPGIGGKTNVFIFELSDVIDDGYPFIDFLRKADVEFLAEDELKERMSHDASEDEPLSSPFIALPCRHNATTSGDELQYAASAAVHEVVHLFNNTYRRLDEATSGAREWAWFDEATAVFFERFLFPKNTNHFQYLQDWADEPEVALDNEAAEYERALFAEHLCRCLSDGTLAQEADPRVLADIWTTSERDDSPLDAIATVLSKRTLVFTSSDVTVADVFGARYCVDAYFLRDWAADVYERFRGRAVAASLTCPHGETSRIESARVDHLACRYYRLYPTDAEGILTVTTKVIGQNQAMVELKTSLLEVLPNMTRGEKGSVAVDNDHSTYTCQLPNFSTEALDHAVLVVANCSHLEKAEYSVDVSVS